MAILVNRATLPILAVSNTPIAQDRRWLALGTLAIFGVVTVFPILAVLWKSDGSTATEDLTTLLQVIFAPVVGIVGTVMGFYFGTQKGDGD